MRKVSFGEVVIQHPSISTSICFHIKWQVLPSNNFFSRLFPLLKKHVSPFLLFPGVPFSWETNGQVWLNQRWMPCVSPKAICKSQVVTPISLNFILQSTWRDGPPLSLCFQFYAAFYVNEDLVAFVCLWVSMLFSIIGMQTEWYSICYTYDAKTHHLTRIWICWKKRSSSHRYRLPPLVSLGRIMTWSNHRSKRFMSRK